MGPEDYVTVTSGALGIRCGRFGIFQGAVLELFRPRGTYQP